MKICLQNILFHPAIGGIENYLCFISKELIKMGHEPTILCSQHKSHLPPKENMNNIQIIRHPYYILPFPLSVINPIYYVKNLQNFLKTHFDDFNDNDVIWSRYLYESYASSKIFKDKIPIIFIQAAISPLLSNISVSNEKLTTRLYSKFSTKQNYFFEKEAVDLCDKIVTLSNVRKKEICDFYDINERKIEVIPPGIDIETFKPTKKDENLLKELDLPENSHIILTVCRLSSEKNLEMLINAFSKIHDKNTYLVIVGDGHEINHLKILIKHLNINRRTRITGFRRDITRFYSIADVFVLPSTYEGFGQVYIEAMASGVPCIGLKSDYPKIIVASDEIIDNKKTGFLVDPYSVIDLKEKIEEILDNNSLRNKMKLNSRLICEEKYSWEKNVDSLIKLSQKLIK